MGYTHYWELSGAISSLEWSNFVVDFQKVLPQFQHLLDDKGSQKLEITSEQVFFNGIGEEAHETFSIGLKGSGFNFCKTAQKPYDVAVTAALIIAKEYFGDSIKVSSDGNDSDWNTAGTMCQERLGYGAKFSVEGDD